MIFTMGKYAGFIISAYLAVIIVLALLIGWIIWDGWRLKKTLRRYEELGLTRRKRRTANERYGAARRENDRRENDHGAGYSEGI